MFPTHARVISKLLVVVVGGYLHRVTTLRRPRRLAQPSSLLWRSTRAREARHGYTRAPEMVEFFVPRVRRVWEESWSVVRGETLSLSVCICKFGVSWDTLSRLCSLRVTRLPLLDVAANFAIQKVCLYRWVMITYCDKYFNDQLMCGIHLCFMVDDQS